MKQLLLLLFVYCFSAVLPAQESIVWRLKSKDQSHTTYIIGVKEAIEMAFFKKHLIIEKTLSLSNTVIVADAHQPHPTFLKNIDKRPTSDEIKKHFKKSQLRKFEKLLGDKKRLYKMIPMELHHTLVIG